MELVGTKVRNTFHGFGTFTGTVETYDAEAGYFRIKYEDGDSEEVDFEEISSILKEMGESSPPSLDHPACQKSNRGRPKKQRRMDPNPTVNPNSLVDLEGDCRKVGPDETLANECEGFRVSEEMQVNGDCNGEEGKRKKRKMSAKEKLETPLRRSARRASAVKPEVKNTLISQDDDLGGEKEPSFLVGKGFTKPTLPPSSKDYDIDGLNVFDLFAVYTCLRSFSRLLFLSPFKLETFLRALRCEHANYLIDSIHFSILHALKKHLELLSEEGSQSASQCLRYLNWELLDLVTWPVFLVQYLSLHRLGMKPGFRLSQLKLLDSEYYEQPAGVKLEILRCLCDDVIEVETIRSELNRRIASEVSVDTTFINMNAGKKRKAYLSIDPEIDTGEEVGDEIGDWNSDECCLCGMDGSLICCDGCPAAFHSRCVGVVKDHLPEGEWYCPECVVERSDGILKLSKLSKGAQVLGIDPHGRVYFCSCDHLLVSDSCETDGSFHYYYKNHLDGVIKVLKSFDNYDAIANAISRYWSIPVDAYVSNDLYRNDTHYIFENVEPQIQAESPLVSKQEVLTDSNAVRVPIENSSHSECDPKKSTELSDLVLLNSVNAPKIVEMKCPMYLSEPFDGKENVVTSVQLSQQAVTGSIVPTNEADSINHTDLTVGPEKCIKFPNSKCMTDKRKAGSQDVQPDHCNYINYYMFGRTASSVSAELMHKSIPDDNESYKTDEDIKSAQLKAISNKFTEDSWHNYENLYMDAQKENCGWCFSCKSSSDSYCLLRTACDKYLEGSKENNFDGPKNPTIGLCSEKNKKSHITSAMHHILSIESRACGLLTGPWEKPHYSQHWRQAVVKATDVASLKPLLLTLELNLRRIALSVDWLKPVEDPHAIVSASIVTSPVRVSSNNVGSRKQARKNTFGDESSFVSQKDKISDIYWWRGGRLSRQLFQCKMLPRALAFKGVRQAGGRKISHLSYSDGVDFAKRSKYVSWQVAVEISQSVAQLSYQVKDFDSNIKWTELSDTRLFPQLAKESKKKSRPVKKVTIRRKCKEGRQVKYLLDFGKREIVPSLVTKHGILLEESSNGKKSYWLNETYVPLNLLKSFEERKISRLLKKTDSATHTEKGSVSKIKKRKRSEWLSYLISRVQKSEKQLCGHCNKDVLVREAVNCQLCNGFFHRKHFRVPKGAISTTYTCSKCKDTKSIAKAIKSKKKDMDMKNTNTKDKDVGNKNVKAKDMISGERKYRDVKNTNVAVKDTKSSKLKDKGKRSAKPKPMELRRSLRVRAQGRKIVLIIKTLSKGKKSKAMRKNQNHVLDNSKKKFTGHERSNRGNFKRGKLENSENWISWHTRKRSVVLYSYWLNGLRWTHKPVTEQQSSTERIVILPFQHIVDSFLKPSCGLCHKEYNPGVTYLRCEKCQDWFHGDAFCLTVEHINNLIGFRCHRCLMRSAPVCPFLENASISDVGLGTEHNTELNIVYDDHQTREDKLFVGSIVSTEDCLNEEQYEEQRDNACVVNQKNQDKYESYLDEVQCQNVLLHQEEELGSLHETFLTNGDIQGLEDMGNEKNNEGGSSEDCFQYLNLLDENDKENVLIHSEKEPSFHTQTLSTDIGSVQSLQQLEANFPSSKNDNEIGVGPALCVPEEDIYRMAKVPDSQVVDQHSDSIVLNPHKIVPTPSSDEV